MAQKWPKITKMAQKWPKMAQKLAPAKKIAEIYLQYLPLFASLPRCNLLFLVCCGRALVIAGDLLIFQLDPQWGWKVLRHINTKQAASVCSIVFLLAAALVGIWLDLWPRHFHTSLIQNDFEIHFYNLYWQKVSQKYHESLCYDEDGKSLLGEQKCVRRWSCARLISFIK